MRGSRSSWPSRANPMDPTPVGWEERVHVLASHASSEPVVPGRSAARGLNPPTLSSPMEGPGASCHTLVLGWGGVAAAPRAKGLSLRWSLDLSVGQ